MHSILFKSKQKWHWVEHVRATQNMTTWIALCGKVLDRQGYSAMAIPGYGQRKKQWRCKKCDQARRMMEPEKKWFWSKIPRWMK